MDGSEGERVQQRQCMSETGRWNCEATGTGTGTGTGTRTGQKKIGKLRRNEISHSPLEGVLSIVIFVELLLVSLASPVNGLLDLGGSVNVTNILATAESYLEKFGYLSKSVNVTGPGYFNKSDEATKTALEFFQLFYGLNPSGSVDPDTLDVMVRPRCGFPDVVPLQGWHQDTEPGTWNCSTGMVWWNGSWVPSSQLSQSSRPQENVLNSTASPASGQVLNFEFFPGAPRWDKFELSYFFMSLSNTSSLTHEQIKNAIRSAFQSWQSRSSFRFTEVTNGRDADIEIRFAVGEHGDNSPFDGQLGVLAHGYSPQTGWLHFDDDEVWVVDPDKVAGSAFDLESVAVHELGHVLGLGHSANRDAIMYPSLKTGTVKRELQADDINGIHQLYGTSAPETPPGDKCSVCMGKADGVYIDDSADCSQGCKCSGGKGQSHLGCARNFGLAADGLCYSSKVLPGPCMPNSGARTPPSGGSTVRSFQPVSTPISAAITNTPLTWGTILVGGLLLIVHIIVASELHPFNV
ncbi:hypothetical protein CBR_g28681 [Chara braunii]|uniref:Peptidase metallopeptidase domain-containing protein n=1 Tax=Chara braunii TaxID=69332 RepID=A0A388L9H7_CHABU|nr:hypothetical protein CBR_g28681 [Chara braunii]|eukprot:GBG78967.1 hypothetical protein CBR_g28681 [Chara braunii]